MIKKFTEWMKPGNTLRDRWREFFEILFLTFMLALFSRVFLVGVYRVTSSSMVPVLIPGDFIWASKISYGLKLPFLNQTFGATYPEKGDMVVIRLADHSPSIMRVVGLPGDHVFIEKQKLFINEVHIPTEPIDPMTQLSFSEKKVYSDFGLIENINFTRETLNSKAYIASYTKKSEENVKNVGPLVVAPGEVFALSDWRESFNGRSLWKLVKVEEIESKVKGIWFSLNWPIYESFRGYDKSSSQVRWERINFL